MQKKINKTAFIVILFCGILLLSLLLTPFMGKSIDSNNINKNVVLAQDYDFEVYFKINGKSKLGLEEWKDNIGGRRGPLTKPIAIDLYLSALKNEPLDVCVFSGWMHFDKDVISAQKVMFDIPEEKEKYFTPLWNTSPLVKQPSDGSTDRVGLQFDCNSQLTEWYPETKGNVPVGKDMKVATIYLNTINELPTNPFKINWDFMEESDKDNFSTIGRYMGDKTDKKEYLDSRVKCTPLQIGDATAEASADLTKLELQNKSGTSENYISSFVTETLEYNTSEIPFADSIEGLKLNYETKSPTATVTAKVKDKIVDVNNITGLINGDVITLNVHDDVMSKADKVYTVTVNIADASNDNTLSNLSAEAGGVALKLYDPLNKKYGFSPDVYNYSIKIPNKITDLDISAIKNDKLATMTIDGKSKTIDGKDITSKHFMIPKSPNATTIDCVIKVTAENKEFHNEYKVSIERAKASSDTSLGSISVSNNDIEIIEGVKNFNYMLSEDSRNFKFSINGKYPDLQKVEYKVGNSSDYIEMKKDNWSSLYPIEKDNEILIYIKVTAENGDTKDYTLNVNRPASSNTELDKVTVTEGETQRTIIPNGDIYKYELGNTGEETITINATGKENSTVKILQQDGETYKEIVNGIINVKDLNPGVYPYIIKVKAQNEKEKQYTINIIKKSHDKELLMPKVQHTKNGADALIEGMTYDANTFTYNLAIDYAINYEIGLKIVNDIRIILTASENSKIKDVDWPELKQGSEDSGRPTSFADVSFNNITKELHCNHRIIVTAEDGSVQEYSINITRKAADDDNTLSDLAIGGVPVEGFQPNILTYDKVVIFPGDTETINITANANSKLATISYNDGEISQISLTRGKVKLIEVKVTAQDGSSKIYKVKVIAANKDNEIDNIILKLKDGSILNGLAFNKTESTYNINVPFSIDVIIFEVITPEDARSTITGNTTKTLTVGQNIQTIYATSEAGEKGKVYKVNITRKAARTDKYLDSLNISSSGESSVVQYIDNFNSNIFEYSIRADRDVLSLKVDASVPSDNGSKIISGLTPNFNIADSTKSVILIYVKAEDGTEQTYKINVVRANDVNEIKDIDIDVEEINFQKVNANYSLNNVAFSVKNINFNVNLLDEFSKLYVKANNNSEILISNPADFDIDLKAGSNKIVIYAKSDFGTPGIKYNFTVNQNPADDNTSLKTLEVLYNENNLLKNFISTNYDYNLRVDESISNIEINAIAAGVNATVSVSPIDGKLKSNHENSFYVTVTAENGKQKQYKVNVTRANDNNKIVKILVDGNSVNLNEGPLIVLDNVPFTKKNIVITAELEDGTATLFGTGTMSLNDGAQTFEVYAISEYGKLKGQTKQDVHPYTLQITRVPAQTDNTLDDLIIKDLENKVIPFDGGIIFKKDRISYTITLDKNSELKQISICATADKNNKNLSGDIGVQNLNIREGGTINDQFVITVTAENGKSKNYTINIIKGTSLSSDCSIKEVTLKDSNGKEDYLSFNNKVKKQSDVLIPYALNGLTLNIIPNDPNATVNGNGFISVDVGSSTDINFKVIAQDGTESLTYSIKISRESAKTENFLKTLTVKDINGIDYLKDIFESGIDGKTTYDIRVNDDIENVIITATIPTDNGSKIVTKIKPSYTLESGRITQVLIVVQAEDETTKTYTINIKRANNDNEIESIKAGDKVIPISEFEKVGENFEFALDSVTSVVNNLNIEVILKNGKQTKATISGDGVVSLKEGINSFPIIVTAQDGTVGDTYILKITREAAKVLNFLDTLIVKDINDVDYLKDIFESGIDGKTTYDIRVNDDIENVTITATVPTDNGSKIITEIKPSYSLESGKITTIVIVVQAEDGSTRDYTINIKRANNDNEIESIKAGDKVIPISEFKKLGGNFEYTLDTVISSVKTLNIEVKLKNGENAKATISGDGLVNIKTGNNTFPIIVTAQDGTVGETYLIRVEREAPSNDNTLNSLKVMGSDGKILINDTTIKDNYLLKVDRLITSVNIEATKNHDGAILVGDLGNLDLVAGNTNSFKIFVTAEDGTKKTYSIDIEVKDDNNVITNINSDLPKLDFDKNNFDYNLDDVAFDVDNINFDISLQNKYAKLFINGTETDYSKTIKLPLNDNDNAFEIYAVSERGTIGQKYSVNITKIPADSNNFLADLSVTDGKKKIVFKEGDFDKNITSYSIILSEDSKITSIVISATAENSISKVEGTGLKGLTEISGIISNDFVVKVTAQNGDVKEYRIKVIKSKKVDVSDDNSIKEVSLIGKGIEYLKDIFDAKLENQKAIIVPYEVESVYLNILADSKATIMGIGNYDIKPGQTKTIQFQVTAENGIKGKMYSVNVTREKAETNNELLELYYKIGKDKVNLDLNKDVYDIYIADIVNQVSIGGIAPDKTKVTGFGVFDLNNDKTTLFINVKAQNDKIKTYALNFIKQNNDSTLKSIKIDDIENFGSFVDGVYEINVPYSKDDITIFATPSNEKAKITGNGTFDLNTGDNVFEIFATSEVGTKGEVYKLKVTRTEADDNNFLNKLIVKDNKTGDVLIIAPEFDKATLKYNIDLTKFKDVNEILIEAETESKFAKIIEGLGTHVLITEQGKSSQTFAVKVEAETGEIKVYEILVTRDVDPDDDVSINDISLIGSDAVNYLGLNDAKYKFEISKTTYDIVVPYKTKNVKLTVTNNNRANITGNDVYELNAEVTTITFHLDSKSGIVSSDTYTVNITKEAPSNDNTLKDLTIDGRTIAEFNPETQTYEVKVALEDVSSVNLAAAANSAEAKVIGDLGSIDLKAGQNTFNIQVKAEDGSIKNYTVTIDRLSNDAEITDLGVTDYKLSNDIKPTFEGFDKSILKYNLTVPYDVEMVNVFAVTNTKATLEGVGHISLVAGETKVLRIYATSEMGEIGKVYNLEITRKDVDHDNTLKSLEVHSGVDGQLMNLNPVFNPNTTDYILEIPEDKQINSLSIMAEANSKFAKGVGGTGYKVLKTYSNGKYNNVFEIIVMAQDNTTRTYTVSVLREDVKLDDDVTVGEVNLIGSDGINYLFSKDSSNKNAIQFYPNKFTYIVPVPYNVESVTLEVGSINATVYGTGTLSFKDENALYYEVYLVSQSKKVSTQNNPYKIKVVRTVPFTDNTLKNIKLNGDIIANFDPETCQYEIDVDFMLQNHIELSAEPNDSTAKVTGIGGKDLVEGRNVFSILVTAQNGNTKSYNVVINYFNKNALLKNLNIFSSTEEKFDEDNSKPCEKFVFNPQTFEYDILVDKNAKSLNVLATADDLGRAGVFNGGTHSFTEDETKITVFVQAVDGKTTNTYTLNIKRKGVLGSENRLKELKISGYPISFNPDTHEYSISVGKNVTDLDVFVKTLDPNAKAKVVGNTDLGDGKNAILVSVTAEDGSETIYKVVVNKEAKPNYFLTIMLIIVFLLWIVTILTLLIWAFVKDRQKTDEYKNDERRAKKRHDRNIK